ncbi:hypothetical protein K6V78_06740 [Streptococcus gallolyticus]|uniref:isoprenylcysteine carboxylmethyltransferase family protein n=1 Tax=Streptococcus hepaticus TaxID=3349163 RepID=UPI001C97B081|nr:hypothetical protein [Streptococcus gallolyticus]MBY5041837.1 hypothetical protein [Streptococcus gallolyticus]
MLYRLVIIIAVFIIRLYYLRISKRNEARILAEGGVEYGQAVSKWITILHILFYLGCFLEACFGTSSFDGISLLGLVLLGCAMWMLHLVVHLLDGIWTVKLMIAKNHLYNPHWLFKTVKHPNYFLNILPELLGLVLLSHAWWTLMLVSPFYIYVLFLRIKEENHLIQTVLLQNGVKK